MHNSYSIKILGNKIFYLLCVYVCMCMFEISLPDIVFDSILKDESKTYIVMEKLTVELILVCC